jgi:large subunit ribosomal protein L15
MKLHELSPARGSKHARKRIGRGPGSGTGKTAGRGEKGQKSRSGHTHRAGFEGGQMPLIRRVPKRGFTNIWRTEYAVVNLSQLDKLAPAQAGGGARAVKPAHPPSPSSPGASPNPEVTPELLVARGLARSGRPIKVLGVGEVGRAWTVKAHRFSKSARAKIEAAGGSCEELEA